VRNSARRGVGLLLFISGGFLLAFAGGRYTVGALRADAARAAWDSVQARQAVAYAHSVAFHTPTREALVPGAPVARLVIPRIGLDEIVLEGVDGDALNAGPGHLSGTVFPGEPGNSVISGHRDRHFNHFDALDVGDTLTTESESGARSWIIVSSRVIGKDDPALFTTRDATLTLTTCWPIRYLGPAPDRLIITAKLLKHAPAPTAS
jgi:LPXTG-site transpeptidase (sortase) family protein